MTCGGFFAFLEAASVIADGAEEGTRADIYREEVGDGRERVAARSSPPATCETQPA